MVMKGSERENYFVEFASSGQKVPPGVGFIKMEDNLHTSGVGNGRSAGRYKVRCLDHLMNIYLPKMTKVIEA